MFKGFLIGFFCFLLFLVIHFIIFHNWKIKKRFIVLLNIFYSLLLLYIFLYILIPEQSMIIMPVDSRVAPSIIIGLSKVFNFFLGISIYLLLFFGYCQFYFIIDRSISVRIMIELEKSKEKKLTIEDIKKAYSSDYILLRRLEQMIDTEYIVKEKSDYKNIRKGIVTAKVFRFLKEYLQIGEGG